MAIGEEFRYLPGNDRSGLKSLLDPIYRGIFLRLYGIADLHTHIRWRAIASMVSSICSARGGNILDVGCNMGLMSFEIARRLPAGKVLGIDTDRQFIKAAIEIKNQAGIPNVNFRVVSAPRIPSVPDNYCDVVLLIDVIEHIVDDRSLLQEVDRILKPGGVVIISVPTANYPRVFGREFHKQVGHVRDGYSIEELRALLAPTRLKIEEYHHYTYPPSAAVCFIYYRWLRNVNYISSLVSPLFNLFSYLDYVWPNRPQSACGIALGARKAIA